MSPQQTNQQITLLALQIASEQGLDNLSLSDLAEAAGIRKATLYSHFVSKEALVDAMYHLIDSFSGAESVSLSGEAETVLQTTVRHWVAAYTTTPMRWAWRVVFQMRFTDPRAASRARAIHNMFLAQTQAVLETLSDMGRLDIPDLDLATTLFASAAESFIDEENITENDQEDWQLSRMVSRFCRTFMPRQ